MGTSKVKSAYKQQVSKLNDEAFKQWDKLIKTDARLLKKCKNWQAREDKKIAGNIVPHLEAMLANVASGREAGQEIDYEQAEKRERIAKKVAGLEQRISQAQRWIMNLHREKNGAPPKKVSQQTRRKWRAMRDRQKKELGELAKNLQGEECEMKRTLRVCWLATRHHRADMKHMLL